jgi:hypothetical protein
LLPTGFICAEDFQRGNVNGENNMDFKSYTLVSPGEFAHISYLI